MIDWRKQRAIITGGAGFIGSHLADALIAHEAEVVIVDDLRRGTLANLAHHDGYQPTGKHIDFADCHPGKLWFCHSRVQDMDWSGIKPTDVVFHLAATVTNIEANRRAHLYMLDENLATNMAMIDAMIRWPPALFIAASTVCVYPHKASYPTPESEGWPLQPEPTNEGYGIAKGVLEKQAEYLHREYSVPVVVPRFSNAIGERDYYDWASSHVLPALIRKAVENQEIEVWGTGQQSRVLIDAKDIVNCILLLADNPAAHDAQPINIGHPYEVTMEGLAFMVVDECHRQGLPKRGVSFDKSKPDGHRRRLVDTTRLLGLTGWIPGTPLEDTIRRMVKEYMSGTANV